jgi:hypothetical protein
LGITTSGEVSKEDILTAYNLLRIIALDEDRPCRRDVSGNDIKSDMTPTMKKAKEQLGVEKRERQDDEVKEITETGRSNEAHDIRSPGNMPETPANAAKMPKLGHESKEETEERRSKNQRRGSGRAHNIPRARSDPPQVTPHTQKPDPLEHMISLTTRALERQEEDAQKNSASSCSTSSSKTENSNLTFAQLVQLEDMKQENLKLQYKILLLQQKKDD